MSALEALAYANLWVALAAVLLTAAAGAALGAPASPGLLAIAGGGTLLVYGVDRLRDLARDRATTPRRSAFVARHRRAIAASAATGGLVAAGAALAAGPRVLAVAACVAPLGFLHRRLKRLAFLKPVYLTSAWTLVTVGLPAAAAPRVPPQLAFAVAIVSGAVLSNVIASNVRDAEAAAARIGLVRALRIARLVALGTALVGALAPAPARALACVPLAMLAALLGFRPTERYGLLVVDGALVLGAAATLALAG